MYDRGIRNFTKVRFSLEKNAINEAIQNRLLTDKYVIYTDQLLTTPILHQKAGLQTRLMKVLYIMKQVIYSTICLILKQALEIMKIM